MRGLPAKIEGGWGWSTGKFVVKKDEIKDYLEI